jgi:glycosyltransferase involved in cell wall biosynthesis
MALGLPVVGTDISGMRQALGIDVAAKCLSPAGDWQTLAERIAERVHNPGLCNLEGAGNRSRIQSEFSCSGMALNCLRLIAETSFQAM